MTRVFETQTITVDPFAPPVVNVNLDKNFRVLEAAILTNTVKASGVREITLGIVYEDSTTLQYSYTLQTILVGQNIAPVSNIGLDDVQTIFFTEFIEHSIKDDTMRLTILTLSEAGVQANTYTTAKFQLDPANEITTGIQVVWAGTYKESYLCNVGSLANRSDVGAGTINGILVVMGQS